MHKAFALGQQAKTALAFPRKLSSKHLKKNSIAVFWHFNDFLENLKSLVGVNTASPAGLKVE